MGNGRALSADFNTMFMPEDSSSRMSLDRTSEPRMKRKGKRGSPCIRTRLGQNLPKGKPSNRIEWETVKTKEALVDPVDLCLVETSQRKNLKNK